MLTEFLSSFDLYSWQVFGILILAGFVVGIVNTLAGSGSVITFSILMALGIPAPVANGTIRIGVSLQTAIASFRFFKKDKLELKKGLLLGIPTVIGTLSGAFIAVNMTHEVFSKIIGGILLLLLFVVLFDPKRWIQERKEKTQKKISVLQIFMFLFIGLYGGFIHIGVGIFFLSALVNRMGFRFGCFHW